MRHPGSPTYVLSCRPASSGETLSSIDRELCPASESARFKIQPTPTYLSSTTAPSVAASDEQGLADLSGVWALAFTSVVGLYLVSAYAGAVLHFIRRG